MYKRFEDLNLNDAFLFAAALEDPDNCSLVLGTLLGVPVGKVKVHVEHTMLYSSDCRSIRLDVYASDEAGYEYNLEMQNENEGNLPKRSRFHQAEMDVMSIKPGEDFDAKYADKGASGALSVQASAGLCDLHLQL